MHPCITTLLILATSCRNSSQLNLLLEKHFFFALGILVNYQKGKIIFNLR